MSSKFASEREFEACLEQVLLERSQTVMAPRRMFDRVKGDLGVQGGRSWLVGLNRLVGRLLPPVQMPTRRVVVAVIPLVAVLVFAVVATSSGLPFSGNSGVADAPASRLVEFGPPPIGGLVPDQDLWTVAAGMNHPRQGHGSVSLHDGRVLVFGGFDSNGPVMTSEIFDADSGTWTTVGEFPYELPNPNPPVVLHDGRVLVVGGSFVPDQPDASTWYLRDSALFNSATEDWELVENMLVRGRRNTNSVLMPDGRVLIYGGRPLEAGWSRDEIFYPSTQTWTREYDFSDLPKGFGDWSRQLYGPAIRISTADPDVDDSKSQDEIPEGFIITQIDPDPNIFRTLDAYPDGFTFDPLKKFENESLVDSEVNFGGPRVAMLSGGNRVAIIGTGSREFGDSGAAYFFGTTPGNYGWLDPSENRDVSSSVQTAVTRDGYVLGYAEPADPPREDPNSWNLYLFDSHSTVWTQIGDFPAENLAEFSVTQLGDDRILITGGTVTKGNSDSQSGQWMLIPDSYSDASYILQLPSE